MRKVSTLSRKIEQFLDKAHAIYRSGRTRAINFEIGGKRFCGTELKDLAISKDKVKFCVDSEKFEIKLEEIKKYKRLRTKKYLFFVDLKKETKKEKKSKKVADKTETSKEDKE